jgi:hypothetical protein
MRSEAEDEPANAAKNKSKLSVARETADAVRLIIAYALTTSTRVNNVEPKSLTPPRRGGYMPVGVESMQRKMGDLSALD